MRSGEYDLMAPAAVGEQMTWERSAPYTDVRGGRHGLVHRVLECYIALTIRKADIDAKKGAPV